MTYRSLNDPDFDETITIRDAYRIMYQFSLDYFSLGDTPISDFVFGYAEEKGNGETIDPAAIDDFMNAVNVVLKDRDKRNINHEIIPQ